MTRCLRVVALQDDRAGSDGQRILHSVSAIGYRLSAIGYRLSAIGYRLSAIGYRLSAIGYSSNTGTSAPPAPVSRIRSHPAA